MAAPLALSARPAAPQDDISGPVSAEASPQLFATMCALLAAGFEADKVSTDSDPALVQLRLQLLELHGPATDALRKYYRDHLLADSGATMSRYLTFALAAGPPPKFAVSLTREELPPELLSLDGFSGILANFYQEAQIEKLWRRMQPGYERDVLLLREPLGRIVLTETGYLRELVRPGVRTFTAYAEPLVGGHTHFRNIGNQYAIVVDPTLDSFDAIRHAFLHFLIDPLPIRYQQQVAADLPLLRIGAAAPRVPPEFRDDFSAFFTECVVRAVELRLRRLPAAEQAEEVDSDERDGYVLIRPLMTALAKFEVSEPAMSLYFPDLVRSIDVAAEKKRLQTLAYAPASDVQAAGEPHQVRNAESEVDAAIALGQRQIAAQHVAAAEATFEGVLAKQPEQTRAIYGLAVASVLQGNKARAQELFGQVVEAASGTNTAAMPPDPVVLAWSHVYLGRMHDLEGDREQALASYRAALSVVGAPEAARSAARHGIEQSYEPPVADPPPG